ncbi:MAG: tRNA (guanosine(37)-N1)-methyltransferase TrmD [Spirochaetales bacterium]|jgi:tRNA (guanine37-N1)-methyltransferase|nr:tRNA (guanosine(37)-N1)-methyltransferase TrmD [Spirochaetales bacterium]
MKFTVLSLFPEILEAYFNSSIMAKAVEKGIVSYANINIRDFAADKHRTCDDAPYGGGAGMVLKPEPLAAALDSVGAQGLRTIYPTPSGRLFTQACARELSAEQEVVLICGRYEGIDQRVIDLYVNDEISLGDYILSSGEIAAMVIIDAVYRLLDGVITRESLEEESFCGGLLEYPHYTRPEVFRGLEVPGILLSGHHANIRAWRQEQSILKTKKNRPGLLGTEDKS